MRAEKLTRDALAQRRQRQSEDTGVSQPGSRNAWYYAECKTHGRQPHLSYLGGRCCVCAAEATK